MKTSSGESKVRDACGIVGIAHSSDDVALPLFYALYALQHRGQESAGIAVSHSMSTDEDPDERGAQAKEIRSEKGMGLVAEVFSPQRLAELQGPMGIGHVRYPTTGAPLLENAEPLVVNYQKGEFALAHNGNLVNTRELRAELEREGRIFHSETDTEVIAQLLARELVDHDPIAALTEVMRRVVGSYSLVILMDNMLLAVRDPFGIKPLCIGALTDECRGVNVGYVIASESPAIDTLGGTLIRDVNPGEVLVVRTSHPAGARNPADHRDLELICHQLHPGVPSAHCVFEYIYFARPDSVIDGQLVYGVRMKIGERLAAEHPVSADIVSPVPDSGITCAIGYAKRSGIEYREGLIKNRYVGRTFIMPEQKTRDLEVHSKFNIVRANVAGKQVVLVDDSIVRGTTMRKLVRYLRTAGAKEVHLRIGSPPIIAPCYLGIDTPTRNELIASTRTIEEIRDYLTADSLGYLSLEGLLEAVGIEANSLCLGCLTEHYPVRIPGERCSALLTTLT
jgi:amidophosphoribosyltransferase